MGKGAWVNGTKNKSKLDHNGRGEAGSSMGGGWGWAVGLRGEGGGGSVRGRDLAEDNRYISSPLVHFVSFRIARAILIPACCFRN